MAPLGTFRLQRTLKGSNHLKILDFFFLKMEGGSENIRIRTGGSLFYECFFLSQNSGIFKRWLPLPKDTYASQSLLQVLLLLGLIDLWVDGRKRP